MKTWRSAVIDDSRLTKAACSSAQPAILEFQAPWFSIYSRDGVYTYETLPQVTILPVVERTSVVMIRARRPAVGDCPLELPAGSVMPGETPRQGAARELAEETGIVVANHDRFKQTLPIAVMSGRCPFLDHVYEVELTPIEYESRAGHDGEVEEVVLMPLSDAVRAIQTGEIYCAVPMAILQRKFLAMNICNGPGPIHTS
jgi:ADP-ribose pyrophosphatase